MQKTKMTQYSLLAKTLLFVNKCDIMMQRHARISCRNPSVPLKLTVLNRAKADSFEHWLVIYLLKNVFLIIFNPKSYGL